MCAGDFDAQARRYGEAHVFVFLSFFKFPCFFQKGECKAKRGSEAHTLRKVIDTAIIKLLVDLDSPQLSAFLASPIPILAEDDDIVQYLTETNQLNGLAMWHRVHGEVVKALELWREIGKEAFAAVDATDAATASQVVGLRDTVELLSTSSDLKLIFKYLL